MRTHLQAFADRAAELSPQTPRPSLRIGINTGPVLVTPEGLAGETTAMGDAVNTASRIEWSAAPGEVLVGRDTYRLTRGVFTVREREPVRVKGKTEPLETYVVDALRPRAFRLRTRGLEGVETRMVGRDEQLTELCRATAASREAGHLEVRAVEGEALRALVGAGRVAVLLGRPAAASARLDGGGGHGAARPAPPARSARGARARRRRVQGPGG